MIESEEKRKRIIDTITHWTEMTKVKPYLREHDIPGLVSCILQEFYHITLCCGHLVNELDEGVDIEFYEYGDESKGIITGTYCKECIKRYKKLKGFKIIK